MPKAISNVDTRFLEDITAIAIRQRDILQLAADICDDPEVLDLLKNVFDDAGKIRQRAIEQRQYVREVGCG
jgi:hypothetical protein